MAESTAKYGLGEAEFQRAIAILDEVEYQLLLLPLPRWERRFYGLYSFLSTTFVVACISSILCVAVAALGGSWESGTESPIFRVSFIVTLLALIGSVTSIPFNLPLLFRIY